MMSAHTQQGPGGDEWAALLAVSQRIGKDPSLVQGPGGNTSLKADGVMWIKASGTWLAHARERPIMVPVDLARLLSAFVARNPACETCVDFAIADLNPSGLRPSIETTMHAVLPQAVVVHVHCVDTIAWACRADAAGALPALLDGLDWRLIPYERPGVPLTRRIREAIGPATDVLVLGNHGLVVAGETTAAAEARLAEVCGRLRRPVRTAPTADLAGLAQACDVEGYAPAQDPAVHAIGTDPERHAIARRGSWYPDHVIFLGAGTLIAERGQTLSAALARYGRRRPPLVVVAGAGALVADEATAGAQALARCLADVTGRLSQTEPLATLSAADEHALLNWDAEKYRQSLDRR
jgi:rhamnose utilization protein RhaD (predicted bifunctional aldolase and dehydrogenase)